MCKVSTVLMLNTGLTALAPLSFCHLDSCSTSMSGYDDAWGSPAEPSEGDIVKDALRKEALMKYAIYLHPILPLPADH